MPTLRDITPRLRVKEAKTYKIEVTKDAEVFQRESDFGPIYDIVVIHDGKPFVLSGGQNLMDNLLPLIKEDGSMTALTVEKNWLHDSETGQDRIEWSVLRA